MTGRVAAIFRHPVKGFTPEPLERVALAAGMNFPGDRIYAVENGPSGFDPARPQFVPKQRFAVLAAIPEVARVRTAYDDARGLLSAEAPGRPRFEGALADTGARAAFEAWLTDTLGEAANGRLKVVLAPGHAFMDHPAGHVSVLNLASLRDLEARVGRALDPARFRANLLVEGWPAWAELDWTGRDLALGAVRGRVLKPIVRCAATHVDPRSAERDIEVTKALFDAYGHMHCGVYLNVTTGGEVRVGDPCGAALEQHEAGA